MKPNTASSYDISVAPGGRKMILIRCHEDGYGMGSSCQTSIVMGGKALKESCRNTGKKNSRPDPETGDPKEIYQYSLQHSDGVCYLYVNETKDETIEEEIEFKLTGLEIEGKPGETKLEIVVGPG